jgi:uncharacterized repeat protein (TIGR01451 family)
VFFSNTGSQTWTKGSDTQVDLAACLADKVTCNAQDPVDSTWNSGWLSTVRYATATQATVAPGALATFSYNIKAPANATATHRFNGDLVVAKTGDRIHPQGYYQDATISAVGNVILPTPTPGSTPFPSAPPNTAIPGGDLSVAKADSPDPVVAGTQLTYTITVDNAGLDSRGVTLTDAIPANTTFASFTAPDGWTTSTPPSGGTGTVTATRSTLTTGDESQEFTLVVNVRPNAGATVTNTATVTSTTIDPTPANNSDTETTTVGAIADLAVTKTDSPDPVPAGANLTYTLTATNAGPSDVQTVALSDVLPAGTTFVSFSQTSGPAFTRTAPAVGGTGTVTATGATFASGATATFNLVVKTSSAATQESVINNTVTIESATDDPNLTNNVDTESTTIVTSADLSVTKSDLPDPVAANENITYTLTVTNAGPSNAQEVSLADVVPANTTFVSFTQTSGPAFTLVTPPAGGTGPVSATSTTLAAGATAAFALVVKVSAATPTGTMISNTAAVESSTTDASPANNSDTETTTVSSGADLSVAKTDSPDPVSAGANLTYTLTVGNAGPRDAQSVSLTDAIPAGSTFVSFTAPAGWTATTPAVGATGTVTATRPTLSSASGPQTFSLVVKVSAAAPTGTTLSNTATLTSATVDPNTANNSATTTTTVAVAADVSVTKTDSPDPITAGANLTYIITAANGGPSDAQSVVLTDVIPANTTFVSFTAPAGWTTTTPAAGATGTVMATTPTLTTGASATFTLVVNVNAVAPAATTISNTATVTSATSDPSPANNSDTETTHVNAALGTLTLYDREGQPAVTICPDGDDNTVDFFLVVEGLMPQTAYVLRIDQTGDGGSDIPFTTDTQGESVFAFDATGVFGQWTAVILTTARTPATNPVTFTLTCQ